MRRQQSKPERKGTQSTAVPGRNSSQQIENVSQTSVEGHSGSNVPAANKKTSAKKDKRHDSSEVKIVPSPIPETSIVPESGVIIQNDPYLLEDLMKEIEMPEKQLSQPGKKQKNFIDARCKNLDLFTANNCSVAPDIYQSTFIDSSMHHVSAKINPVLFSFVKPSLRCDAGLYSPSYHPRISLISRIVPFSLRFRFLSLSFSILSYALIK